MSGPFYQDVAQQASSIWLRFWTVCSAQRAMKIFGFTVLGAPYWASAGSTFAGRAGATHFEQTHDRTDRCCHYKSSMRRLAGSQVTFQDPCVTSNHMRTWSAGSLTTMSRWSPLAARQFASPRFGLGSTAARFDGFYDYFCQLTEHEPKRAANLVCPITPGFASIPRNPRM